MTIIQLYLAIVRDSIAVNYHKYRCAFTSTYTFLCIVYLIDNKSNILIFACAHTRSCFRIVSVK